MEVKVENDGGGYAELTLGGDVNDSNSKPQISEKFSKI